MYLQVENQSNCAIYYMYIVVFYCSSESDLGFITANLQPKTKAHSLCVLCMGPY